MHKKEETPLIPPINSCRPTKKDEISLPNARLPPRPQGLPNYKLPPRPSYHIPMNNSGVNRSNDLSQRDSSKENLKNIGARIVNDCKPAVMTPINSRMGRCNSAQKVIYPSWWGWWRRSRTYLTLNTCRYDSYTKFLTTYRQVFMLACLDIKINSWTFDWLINKEKLGVRGYSDHIQPPLSLSTRWRVDSFWML